MGIKFPKTHTNTLHPVSTSFMDLDGISNGKYGKYCCSIHDDRLLFASLRIGREESPKTSQAG